MHKKKQIRPGLRNEPAKEEKLTFLLSDIILLKSTNNVSLKKLFIHFSTFYIFVRDEFAFFIFSLGGHVKNLCMNI
ncbi:hypothetical protein Bamy02_06980 [Bacillus amyloliquefaciens]|nr:hypothetical protein AAV29_08740 [Bacillus velezensis]GLZ63645.1 hypothetical protein Bamy02_06980 [Bacillus amyloliquefaciens]